MNTNYLALVLPRSELPQNTEQARKEMWCKSANLLRPALGKLYNSFYPAVRPWDIELNTPFSVLMGDENPIQFSTILAAATMAQDEAVAFHAGELLLNMDADQMSQIGDVLICPVDLSEANPRLKHHALWQIGLHTGGILPDSGIYYMAQKCAVASPEQKDAIMCRLADFALCVAALEVGEAAL